MEDKLFEILDLCAGMTVRQLECIIANLEIMKENKIEEENENE